MRVLFWLAVVLPVLAGSLLVAVIDSSLHEAVAEVELAGLGGRAPSPINGLEDEPVVPCDDGDPWTLDQVKHYPDQCVHEDLCVSYSGVLIVQRGSSTCESGQGSVAVAADASTAITCVELFPVHEAVCQGVVAVAAGASSAQVCMVNDGLGGTIRCSDVFVGASNASSVAACNSRFGGSCDDILAIAQNGSAAVACGGAAVSCERVAAAASNGSTARSCIAGGCANVSATAANDSTAQACDGFRSFGNCTNVSSRAANSSEAFACDYICSDIEVVAVNASEARACDSFTSPDCERNSAEAYDGSIALACADGPYSHCSDSQAQSSGASGAVACSTSPSPSGGMPCAGASAIASAGTEAVAGDGEHVVTP